MQDTREQATELYARLHRAVESGEATDDTWQRLAAVCIQLGKRKEAIDCTERVRDAAERLRLRRSLMRRGWLAKSAAAAPGQSGAAGQQTVTNADLNPNARAKLEDAVQFLCDGRMPWVVLAGTAAFPIAMGIGGVAMALTGSIAGSVLAFVPVLLVLGFVGAFGRHVLISAIHDRGDAADLPEPADLWREVPAFLKDFGALAGMFVLPIAALLLLGQAQWATMAVFAAAYFLPMAAALRMACRDWRALHPKTLFAAVRGCPNYLPVAGLILATFAPAVLVWFLTSGMPLFLVVAIVGPLSTAPFLVAMRMMGQLLHYEGAPKGFELPRAG